MADELWSDDELRAAVDLYLQVMAYEHDHGEHNKASLHRELIRDHLRTRSEGSVGRRMSNISATLQDAGEPFARGYKPTLGHVGHNVRRRILAIVAEKQGDSLAPTADPTLLAARTLMSRARFKVGEPPPEGKKKPSRVTTRAEAFVRDPAVRAYVLEAASGICEACGSPAPFLDSQGEPFLEVHHVDLLADGGPDVVTNAVALCPTCHRRLHHSSDRQNYRQQLLLKVARLKVR